MNKIDFEKLEIVLRNWLEIEFEYNWNLYSILNFYENWKSSRWFLCDKLWIDYEICNFDEKDYLISWISKYRIYWKTIKEIFENLIYNEKSLEWIPDWYFNL